MFFDHVILQANVKRTNINNKVVALGKFDDCTPQKVLKTWYLKTKKRKVI